MNPTNMPPDYLVQTVSDLAQFLGGSDTSFTGDLLRLIAKADVGNRARLRLAFPEHVSAWEAWMATSPPSVENLLMIMGGAR